MSFTVFIIIHVDPYGSIAHIPFVKGKVVAWRKEGSAIDLRPAGDAWPNHEPHGGIRRLVVWQ